MLQKIRPPEDIEQGGAGSDPQQIEASAQHQHLTWPQASGQVAALGFHPASAAIKLPISRAWRP